MPTGPVICLCGKVQAPRPVQSAPPPAPDRDTLVLQWIEELRATGRASVTVAAYARAVQRFFAFCDETAADPLAADRTPLDRFTLALLEGRAPGRLDSAARVALSASAVRQHQSAIASFHTYTAEARDSATRADAAPARVRPQEPVDRYGVRLPPRREPQPWIPCPEQWRQVLGYFDREPLRNRLMLNLAYDAALARSDLCDLRLQDLDLDLQEVRVGIYRTRLPYSPATAALLEDYLADHPGAASGRGPLFLSQSRRNHGQSLSAWTWSAVVRRVAVIAQLPSLCPTTPRHLRLAQLAHAGMPPFDLARFAGHRGTAAARCYYRAAQATCANTYRVGEPADAPPGLLVTCSRDCPDQHLGHRVDTR